MHVINLQRQIFIYVQFLITIIPMHQLTIICSIFFFFNSHQLKTKYRILVNDSHGKTYYYSISIFKTYVVSEKVEKKCLRDRTNR